VSIILYCGSRLDSTLPDRPVVVRGYDTAGNQLLSVQAGARVDADVYYSSSQKRLLFDAMDRYGNSIRAKTIPGEAGKPPLSFTPGSAILRPDGYLFCASAPVSSQSQAFDDYDTTAYAFDPAPYNGPQARCFFDYFRVYHLVTGRRVDFPDLHGGEIHAIAIDPTDWSIYVCGEPVGANEYVLRKYDSSGTLIWSYGNDRIRALNNRLLANATRIALNSSGDVFIGGDIYAEYPDPESQDAYDYWGYAGLPRGQGWIARIDQDDGSEIWQRSLSAENHHATGDGYLTTYYQSTGLSIGDDDHLYMTGQSNGYHVPNTVTAGVYFDANHYEYALHKWDKDSGLPTALGLCAGEVSGYNNFYSFNGKWRNGALHVFTQKEEIYTESGYVQFPTHQVFDGDLTYVSGDEYLPAPSPGETFDRRDMCALIEIDSDGNFYEAVRSRVGATGNLFHFWSRSSALAQRWAGMSATAAHGVDYLGVEQTRQDYLDAVYSSIDGRDVGPDRGRIINSKTLDFWASATISICDDPLIPALPLRLEMGQPGWIGDTYTQCPPLALRLALGLPGVRREYAGALRLPDVYRATLADLPLTIRTIQIRRGADGAVTLTLSVPLSDVVTIPALLARVGDPLTLLRGVRFLDGLEQLEPMLAVTLDSVRADAGAQSGSATLSGSATEIARSPLTRTLRGISYRSSGAGGARVRCSVDTYLRPGDTADLGGGETMPVTEVTYSISATSALMELS
jgi:hypothetical protein